MKFAVGPLFVHMAGAIMCLLCSATFHLFNVYSVRVQAFLARLDYGGISFLIAGSTFPPVIYGFACNPLPKWFYISLISSFCMLAFITTLIPGADAPRYRKLRGLMFIFVGLSAGIPAFHAATSRYFVLSVRMCSDPNIVLHLFYWPIGGIVYVSGALIYIARIPERFAPGKFDFCVSVETDRVDRDKATTYSTGSCSSRRFCTSWEVWSRTTLERCTSVLCLNESFTFVITFLCCAYNSIRTQ